MKNKKIKILEIINDASIGGGQVHIHQLLKQLNRDRFMPMIMCSQQGEMIHDFIHESELFSPIHIGKGIHPISLIKNIYSMYKIFQFIRDHHVDVIHTHGGIAGLWGRLSAVFVRRVTVIHTFHGIHFLHYQNSVLRKLYIVFERFLSRCTDMVVCVSESDRENGLHNKLFKHSKSMVIRNGIGKMAFGQNVSFLLKSDFGIKGNEYTVCHVARLDYVKGQIYLLEAIKWVIEIIPNVKLLVVGTGPLKKRLFAYSQELGLNNHIRFLNYRKDIFNILYISDLFVLSSLWEGLPLSILEAMVLGKPIVATAVDGIRDVIENEKDGLLVPPKNSKALAAAIVKLLQDRRLAKQMGKRAKRKAEQQFNVKSMIEQTENLYTKVYF